MNCRETLEGVNPDTRNNRLNYGDVCVCALEAASTADIRMAAYQEFIRQPDVVIHWALGFTSAISFVPFFYFRQLQWHRVGRP